MKKHKVEAGECVSAVARRYGVAAESIANLPANRELADLRNGLDVLAPGDVVVVPPVPNVTHRVSVGTRGTFIAKLPRAELRLQLRVGDQVLADAPYRLEVGSETWDGSTDADGMLAHAVDPLQREGTLTLTERRERYVLDLGNLEPANDWSGAGKRLYNLGYGNGETHQEAVRRALVFFQRDQGIPASGELDETTTSKLIESHGS